MIPLHNHTRKGFVAYPRVHKNDYPRSSMPLILQNGEGGVWLWDGDTLEDAIKDVTDNNIFDFGRDRYVNFGDLTDRKDYYMIPYYLAIGKTAKFNETVGIITNIGEDNHDYWIEVKTDERVVLCSPLDKWNIL